MAGLKELLLFLPRLARMVASLIADPAVPVTVKVVLVAVAAYLASPVDLLPDFIPLVGYLDDILLAAVVVDGLLNYLDRSLLVTHWPGGPNSLDTVAAVSRRLARWVPMRLKRRVFGGRRP